MPLPPAVMIAVFSTAMVVFLPEHARSLISCEMGFIIAKLGRANQFF
jgi:hypothetical protein